MGIRKQFSLKSQYSYSSKIEYSDILKDVQEDIQNSKNISRDTFENIIRWKAERNLNNVKWSQFEIYTEAIKDVLNLPENQKACRIEGLPGIGLPNASTILHLIYPEEFPIVDIRTVRVLLSETQEIDGKLVNYLDPRYKIDYYRFHLWGYYLFKKAIIEIAKFTKKGLREIDKALFAYDKKSLNI